MRTWWISLEGVGGMITDAEDERTAVELAVELADYRRGRVLAWEIYLDRLSVAFRNAVAELPHDVVLTRDDLIAAGLPYREVKSADVQGDYRGTITT